MQRAAAAGTLCPIIALFDYAAAFPSVIHAWILLVLAAVGATPGFIDIINSFYFCCRTSSSINEEVHFLFGIVSGVLQGCPLSGMLFAIAIDPFLRSITSSIDEKRIGATRACADDIAVALASLYGLCELFPCFDAAEKLAGLSLKPKKCVVVPAGKVLTDELGTDIKRWLERNLPSWQDFNIRPVGKYLGFMVGPSSAASQWAAACSKYRTCTVALARTGAPASVALYNYNVRAVPVLGYLQQLLLPPLILAALERPPAAHTLHLATNSFDERSLFAIAYISRVRVMSLTAQSLAALCRASVKTLPMWRDALQQLEEANADNVSGCDIAARRPGSHLWDSPAIASTLAWAAEGLLETRTPQLGLPKKHYIIKNPTRLREAHKIARRQPKKNPKEDVQKAFYDQFHLALYSHSP